MSACSNITMPSEAVAQMAQDCIKRIADYRERTARDWCELERKEWSTRFWAWLTRSPLPTDEELRAGWAAGRDCFSKQFMLKMLCWESEDIAKRLLNASKHAPEVSVSVYDLELVAR